VTRPDADIAGAAAAHTALLSTLDGLTDAQARAASNLPGWTVGHVLTHLARNADSHVLMLEAADRGEIGDQYPGGHEQRAADIEAGASRPAAELVADVRTACAQLEAAWAALSDAGWEGAGRTTAGEWPVADLPFRRWREVEIHHADLGLSFTWRDWSDPFLAADLPRTLAGLPERLAHADRAALLAFLLGRADQPDLSGVQPWQTDQRR
jgi:maleylpyruvate isomerase